MAGDNENFTAENILYNKKAAQKSIIISLHTYGGVMSEDDCMLYSK